MFVVYIAKKIPFFKNLNVFFTLLFFFTEKSPFETQLTRKTTRLRMRFGVFECESLCTSIGTGMIANVLVFAHKFVWIFFTVCECILGEKFAMSSARIGLRGLLLSLYCFFFIEFHL